MNNGNCLWLDDARDPREHGYSGALWIRSAKVAIQIIMDNPAFFSEMSLDHDLAGNFHGHTGDCGNGYDLILYLEETGNWPTGGVRIHSSNLPARARMLVPVRAYYGRDFQFGLE